MHCLGWCHVNDPCGMWVFCLSNAGLGWWRLVWLVWYGMVDDPKLPTTPRSWVEDDLHSVVPGYRCG